MDQLHPELSAIRERLAVLETKLRLNCEALKKLIGTTDAGALAKLQTDTLALTAMQQQLSASMAELLPLMQMFRLARRYALPLGLMIGSWIGQVPLSTLIELAKTFLTTAKALQ